MKKKGSDKKNLINAELFCHCKTGRKCILSEKQEKILEGLRRGYTDTGACAYANINRRTYYYWISKGELAEENGVEDEFFHFLLKVRQAKEEANNFAIDCWQRHIPNDWRAAMAFLERRDPDNFNIKQKLDVTQSVEVSQKAILELPDNGKRNIDNRN